MGTKQSNQKSTSSHPPSCHYQISLHRSSVREVLGQAARNSWVDILYPMRGQIILDVNDTRYIINPGDFFLYWTEEPHKVLNITDDCACWIIRFDRELLYSTSQSSASNQFLFTFTAAGLSGQRLFTREELVDSKLLSLLTDLLEEHDSPGICSEVSIQLFLCQICLCILRLWKAESTNEDLSETNDLYSMNLLQKIFSYVDTEYPNKIKMETIANLVNMSYYSFSKFFIAHTGKTFPSYVNEVRLTKSKILLTTTGMNITEIAMEVGYLSTSRFIQRFKESNSMTPQQFRKEFNKNL